MTFKAGNAWNNAITTVIFIVVWSLSLWMMALFVLFSGEGDEEGVTLRNLKALGLFFGGVLGFILLVFVILMALLGAYGMSASTVGATIYGIGVVGTAFLFIGGPFFPTRQREEASIYG